MFGTDGIRGTVNSFPMTAEIALRFGMAAGIYLRTHHIHDYRYRAIIAKDTRLSGYLLEPALTAGLIAVGVDVTLVGPMPTPAVPILIKSLRADFGIMITASHNPYHDNGFKLFRQNGQKMSEQCEAIIQDMITQNNFNDYLASPDLLGRAMRLDDAQGRYIEHVKSILPRNLSLSHFRIVLDCANGAAYKVGAAVFWELGAEVITIGNEPNGLNINENFGSMHPNNLVQKVLQTRADLGIALDGDADRILLCDENGKIIDGDHLIAAIAMYLKSKDTTQNCSNVALTHISNGALFDYFACHNIKCFKTNVGDRNIASAMREHGCIMGGERSGHIIINNYCTTGDGLIAALCVLSAMIENGQKASELFALFELYPQINHNIPYFNDNPLENQEIIDKLADIQEHYVNDSQNSTRIIVRKSGTENLIRVMVESKSKEVASEAFEQIKAILG